MSMMAKCERCGNVVELDKRFFLPDLAVSNSPRDVCDECWAEFKWWWQHVIRQQGASA